MQARCVPRIVRCCLNRIMCQLQPFCAGKAHCISGGMKGAFLLIHYGVLERMYGKPEKIYKMLETWSKADEKAGEEKKQRARRVVVTSGRGSHSLNLPPSVCFVNLSSVLYSFCESRNKYLISVLLNQSRRKTNE